MRERLLAVLLSIPAAFGLVWLGCAAADEEVDATPKRPPRDSSVEEVIIDEETGLPIDTGGPPTDGSKPLCTGKTATPNACTTATDLGTLTVGGSKMIDEGIAEAAGDVWYKVTFGELTNLAAHPSVKLTSTDPNIVMEVNKSCAGESVSCADEAGVARNVKDYEVKYEWETGTDPLEPGADGGMFKPIDVGDGGAVYIHVFRLTSGPKTACDFKLAISN